MVNGHYHAQATLTSGKFPITRGIGCWVGRSVGLEERVALDSFIIPFRYSNPCTGLDKPRGIQEVGDPRFQDGRLMKVARLSALRSDRFYPVGSIPGTHLCYRLSRPEGHSAAERIMSNSIVTIGNRTCDLSACRAVPPPPTPPRAPY